jgi:hypothetical protein
VDLQRSIDAVPVILSFVNAASRSWRDYSINTSASIIDQTRDISRKLQVFSATLRVSILKTSLPFTPDNEFWVDFAASIK